MESWNQIHSPQRSSPFLSNRGIEVAIVNEYPNDPISAVDDLIKRVVPSQ